MVEYESERDVCAIVVTFNPDITVLGSLLAATRSQVGALVVVDNGSAEHVVSWLHKHAGGANGAVIPLPGNVGVAAAHNTGIDWARQHGFSHVLLMDQDSIPMPGMVKNLITSMIELTGRGSRVAAAGPRRIDARTGQEAPFVRFGFIGNKHSYCAASAGPAGIATDFLITSGTLIPLAVIDDIGRMDESLFIDNVDMDWCFRAVWGGYQLYGICNALMTHRLGDEILSLWFLGRRKYVRHSPVRLYYMMRNRLLLYARPYTPGKWIFRDIFRLAGKLVLFSVLLPPRFENGRMMFKGLWHGLIGRTGKYD
jgi:rhamnosyltransferase